MDKEQWNERYDAADLVWTAGPNQTFAGIVGPLAPGRALDLAAGEGRNAVWLAERGWDVTAVDFSDVALAKADQIAAARGQAITALVEDVLAYEPAPGAFDLVAVIYLHLPAEQLRTVHRRAGEAVASGGTLVVLGHDTTNLTDGYGGPPDPTVLFTPDDVRADLAGTGLTVEAAERVHRTVATDDGDRTAIDALVVAHR